MTEASCETAFGKPLILQGVKAQGQIEGRMLEMTLEQRYRNPLGINVEVVYTFPLPYQAVLLSLEVEINGETLTAVVKQREEARAEYEEALSEGNTGILVNVNPDRSYTLELGNLMARESCLIRLRYVQVLQPAQGSLRMTLPVTLAPRYGDPVLQGRFEPHAVPQIDSLAEYPFDIQLKVRGELAYAQVTSPSHQMATRHVPAGKPSESPMIDIRLAHDDWLDRDLVLVFSELRHASLGLAAQDRKTPGTGVVMASFTPRFPAHEPLPVTVKILVDCSGSMNGDSIEAARRALHGILAELRDGDRFSLSRFGTTVQHRSRGLWKAAPPAKAAAHRWIVNLDASLGGTEMECAILSTLRIAGAKDATRLGADVLLITDGEVHDIDGVLEAARQSGHRFFVVGIGASPAESLIRRLADATGGACEFVHAGEHAEAAILRMFHRMRSLVASNVQVQWPVKCQVLMSTELPLSVFDGDDVTVYAHLGPDQPDTLKGPVRLTATLADGSKAELAQLQANFIEDKDNTLARLAMAEHDRQSRDTKDDEPGEQHPELGALAQKYQLVTPDTSLILIKQRDPDEQASDMPELVQVKSMLAAGWGGHGSIVSTEPVTLRSMSSDAAPTAFSVPSVWRTAGRRSSRRTSSFAQLAMQPLTMETLREHLVFNHALAEPGQKQTPHTWVAPKLKDEYWCLEGKKPTDKSDLSEGYQGLSPAGLVEGLRINPQGLWPRTYRELDAICLGTQIIDWLELVIGYEQDEQLVVQTFIEVMAQMTFTSLQAISALMGSLGSRTNSSGNQAPEHLRQRIWQGLDGITALQWPEAILKMAEFEQSES